MSEDDTRDPSPSSATGTDTAGRDASRTDAPVAPLLRLVPRPAPASVGVGASQVAIQPDALVPPRATACTDLGNAERFADQHRDRVRYSHALKKWLVYDGRRWRIDTVGVVEHLAKETVRGMYREAAMADDDARRADLARHAQCSERRGSIAAMLDLARDDLAVAPEAFDADPYLLNVANGTLDLRTGRLRPHTPGDLLTRLAPVPFDPAADCPAFAAFLARVLPDAGLRDFVRRAVGYSLTGDAREDVFLLAHGTGANGKTTLFELLLALFGDYGLQTPTDTLLARRAGGIPNDVARLRGARLVCAAEGNEGQRLAEGLVKQLTGGDRVAARFLYGEYFEFTPAFTLWFVTNHKPEIRGTDDGIWRRIRLVPFTETIAEAERDAGLPDRLHAELPGILNWALAGCRDWQKHGLGVPGAVRAATDEYRAEMDVLGTWIAERCVVDPAARETAGLLHHAFTAWCRQNGEAPLSQRLFGTRLKERGLVAQRDGRSRYWRGITLQRP